MSGRKVWAYFLRFPATLDDLDCCIAVEDMLPLALQEEYITDYYQAFPYNDVQAGDYILFVVSHNNVQVIDRLTKELKAFPNEWQPEQYHTMLSILEGAKDKYSVHDGKVFYKTTIETAEEMEEGINEVSYNEGICFNNDRPIDKYSNDYFIDYDYIQRLSTKEFYVLNRTLGEDRIYIDSEQTKITNQNDLIDSYDDNVQAFVTNNTFNGSLDEVLADMKHRGYLTLDCLFQENETSWTAPRWCKAGDIAFFMFAKTANAAISKLVTEFRKTGNNYSSRDQRLISEALDHGKDLYKQYGGCIFAFARVTGATELIKREYDSNDHWRNPIYAPMDQVTILENPISIDEFRSFLTIARQNTITPVLGNAFDELKKLIIEKNEVPEFFYNLNATPIPLRDINETNWIEYGKEYRRRFILEEAFRRYYVDYLLRELGDKKTFYRECGCYKAGGNPPRVDNIIMLFGKYLPVEVKLNVNNERDLEKQVKQYCHVSYIALGNGKEIKNPTSEMYVDNVLIIDTENVYVFDFPKNIMHKVYSLNSLISLADVKDLRGMIKVYLK